MSPLEKALWNELLEIAPPHVLANADRWVARTACILMAKMRQYGIGRRGLQPAQIGQLINCLGKMGMTPVDRSRIIVPPHEEQQNPFAQIAAEVTKSVQ